MTDSNFDIERNAQLLAQFLQEETPYSVASSQFQPGKARDILLDGTSRNVCQLLIDKAHILCPEWVDRKRLSVITEPLGNLFISDATQNLLIGGKAYHALQFSIPVHGNLLSVQNMLESKEKNLSFRYSIISYFSKILDIDLVNFAQVRLYPQLLNRFVPLYFSADSTFELLLETLHNTGGPVQIPEIAKLVPSSTPEFHTGFISGCILIAASDEASIVLQEFALGQNKKEINSELILEWKQILNQFEIEDASYLISPPSSQFLVWEDFTRMFILKWSLAIQTMATGRYNTYSGQPLVTSQKALSYSLSDLAEITHLNFEYPRLYDSNPQPHEESVFVQIRTSNHELHSIVIPYKVVYTLGEQRIVELVLQYFRIHEQSPFKYNQQNPLSFKIPESTLKNQEKPITFRKFAEIYSSRNLETPSYE